MADSCVLNGKYEIPGQHVYEGIIMAKHTPQSHLEKVKDMEIFDDDVIISAYPKSGTTLLQEIVWLILHDADLASANMAMNWERVPYIESYSATDGYDGLEHAKQTSRPRLFKTYFPERLLPHQVRQKEIKQITIFRNPKDVMVSYYFYYQLASGCGNFTGTWDEFFEMAMVSNIYRGNVFDHVAGWWARRHDPNVFILFYEDVVRYRKREVMKIANFLGKSLSEEDIDKIVEATDFKSMKSNPMTNGTCRPRVNNSISPFMRRGTVGDWKNYFTINQNRRFDEMIEEKIGGLGIDYAYE